MAANGIQLHVEGIDRALAESRQILEAMGEKQASTAIARALNRAMDAAKAEATRIARQAYTAPAKKMWDNLRVTRATASSLHGELKVSGTPGVSLIHFRARPNTPTAKGKRSTGVSAQIKRDGGRKTYSNAFVMKKRQGGFGVFVREAGKTAAGKNRFRMLLGPSPIQALERQADQERIMERAETVFGTRLKHEIDAIINGIVSGGR